MAVHCNQWWPRSWRACKYFCRAAVGLLKRRLDRLVPFLGGIACEAIGIDVKSTKVGPMASSLRQHREMLIYKFTLLYQNKQAANETQLWRIQSEMHYRSMDARHHPLPLPG